MAKRTHHGRDPRKGGVGGQSGRRRKGVNTPNHPQRVAARLRHAEWVRRRVRGDELQRIADDDGVAISTVSEAITAYMAEVGQPEAQTLRGLQNARLDLAFREAIGAIEDAGPDVALRTRAVDTFVRVHKRFSEVNGCDAPARAPVDDKGNTVGLIDGQDPVALLLGRLDSLATRRDAGGTGGEPHPGAGGADAL